MIYCINPIIPCWHTKCQHIKLNCWSHHFPVAFSNDNKRHLSFATQSTCAISKKPSKLLVFFFLHKAVICVAESDQLSLHGEWRSKGKFTCLSCLLLIWIVATLSVALCHHPSEIRPSYIFPALLFIEPFNKYIFFPWSPLFVCVCVFCFVWPAETKGCPQCQGKRRVYGPNSAKHVNTCLAFNRATNTCPSS